MQTPNAQRRPVSTYSSPRPADEMYPPGFATWLEPEGHRTGLEETHRPGPIFRGVATVCLKLFNIVRPQGAWFGRKDAQQVAVLKQLVRDLNLGVAIHVVETVRDEDGGLVGLSSERTSDSRRAGTGARDPARACHR